MLQCPALSPARRGTLDDINNLLIGNDYAQTDLENNPHFWVKTVLNGGRGGQNRPGEWLSRFNKLANRLVHDLHQLRETLLPR